jgi:photosystem II stability/assembly factor-like uncharacterized protein
VIAASIIFVAALVATTIIFTSRDRAGIVAPVDAPGVWSAQDSRTAVTLLDVDFVDSSNGWAVGHNGTVLHTSDGGSSWEAQDSGTTVNLNSVTFTGLTQGWAVGQLGVIIHTSDGGLTWAAQGVDVALQHNLVSVSFVDDRNGWALTERGGTILSTRDGGENWSRDFLSSTSVRGGGFFLDGQRGWIAFTAGGVFRTVDGGETWQLGPSVNGVTLGQTNIYFTDENNGWIAGWRGRKIGVRSGIEFSKYLSDGMVARTTDGGRSWTRHDVRTDRFLWDVIFLNELQGWAVGSFGSLLYSIDGGVTWKAQASGTEEILRKVDFPSPRNGWAVGDNGTILHFTGG